MAARIHALVALDEGVDSNSRSSRCFPTAARIEVVGIINGLEESWRTLQETRSDLLIVACEGYSDRALYFIDAR